MREPTVQQLVDALVRELPESVQAVPRGEGLGDAIQAFWTEARQAWPELEVDVDRWMAFVAKRLGGAESLADAITALRPGDLLLCWACLASDASALAIFDASFLAGAAGATRRLGLPADEQDEVRQLVAQRLLVGTRDRGPRLEAYSGRGELRNWVRTAAVRVAQNRGATQRNHDDSELQHLVARGPDPDLAVLKEQYGRLFRDSFEAAVTDLTAKQRTLLRLAYVEGMTSDRLAAMYQVHRATAARWVASARDRLSARTRHRMMNHLRIGRGDLTSIFRLIQSQIDVSVRRCLGPSVDSSKKSRDED